MQSRPAEEKMTSGDDFDFDEVQEVECHGPPDGPCRGRGRDRGRVHDGHRGRGGHGQRGGHGGHDGWGRHYGHEEHGEPGGWGASGPHRGHVCHGCHDGRRGHRREDYRYLHHGPPHPEWSPFWGFYGGFACPPPPPPPPPPAREFCGILRTSGNCADRTTCCLHGRKKIFLKKGHGKGRRGGRCRGGRRDHSTETGDSDREGSYHVIILPCQEGDESQEETEEKDCVEVMDSSNEDQSQRPTQ